MADIAKLYLIAHPRTPHMVYYSDPTRTANGRAKMIRKYFANIEDAKVYQADLNKRLSLTGVAGVQFDAAARADYMAARTLLEAQGHGTLTLLELARDFIARTLTTKGQPLGEALDAFLEDQRRGARSEETIKNLETRIKVWIRMIPIKTTDEIRKEHLDCLLERGVKAATRRNDLAAVSSFCTWLIHEGALEDNPCKKVRRPREQRAAPHIWTPLQAQRIMHAGAKLGTVQARNGLACLVLAGLRPSEVPFAKIYLDATPCVKVEGGKLKGRANRIIAIQPAHVGWFEATHENKIEGAARGLSRYEREQLVARAQKWLYKNHPGGPQLEWKHDTPRHTWISQRLTLTGDEKLTAKEAGNSPDVIFRNYHKLITQSDADAFQNLTP